MRERPIIFSAPMVRAILSGAKTQTRRAVKPQPSDVAILPRLWSEVLRRRKEQDIYGGDGLDYGNVPMADGTWGTVRCPYGTVGDRLWVKENYQYCDWTEDGQPWVRYQADGAEILHENIPDDEWGDKLANIWAELSEPENYAIDNRAADRRWRPSIHMPRWASRILLEVVRVRVERLQAINEVDAIAEGADPVIGDHQPYRAGFMRLWESINGPGSWDANPWVWAVSFRRAET